MSKRAKKADGLRSTADIGVTEPFCAPPGGIEGLVMNNEENAIYTVTRDTSLPDLPGTPASMKFDRITMPFVIQSDEEHQAVLKRIDVLMDMERRFLSETCELQALVIVVETYEAKNFPLNDAPKSALVAGVEMDASVVTASEIHAGEWVAAHQEQLDAMQIPESPAPKDPNVITVDVPLWAAGLVVTAFFLLGYLSHP